MEKDPRQWVSIGRKMIGGTAKPVHFPSVIPEAKSEKEVFWVSQLFKLIPEFENKNVTIKSNEDDSEGNHDVLACLENADSIGIQVTELTSELRKNREPLSRYYTRNIINSLHKVNANSNTDIAASVIIKGVERKKPKFPKPNEIAELVKEKSLSGFSKHTEVEDRGYFKVAFQPLTSGTLFIPNHGRIGVSVNYDALPRALDMYTLNAHNLRLFKPLEAQSQ